MKYPTTYIRNGNIGISESIQAGRSIISIMKEHCFRLSREITKSDNLNEFYEFKTQLSQTSLQLLSLTEQHLSRGKLWTSLALTEIESLKYRTQDELYDILEKGREDSF